MKKETKIEFKKKLLTALLISAELIIILLTTVVCIGNGYRGFKIDSALLVFLAVLSILSAIASSLIAFFTSDRFSASFFAFIWIISGISHLVSLLTLGAESVGSFASSFILIGSFPMYSIMPVLLKITTSASAIYIICSLFSFAVGGFNIFSAVRKVTEKDEKKSESKQ